MKKIKHIEIYFEDGSTSIWTVEKLKEAQHIKEILRDIERLSD